MIDIDSSCVSKVLISVENLLENFKTLGSCQKWDLKIGWGKFSEKLIYFGKISKNLGLGL